MYVSVQLINESGLIQNIFVRVKKKMDTKFQIFLEAFLSNVPARPLLRVYSIFQLFFLSLLHLKTASFLHCRVSALHYTRVSNFPSTLKEKNCKMIPLHRKSFYACYNLSLPHAYLVIVSHIPFTTISLLILA